VTKVGGPWRSKLRIRKEVNWGKMKNIFLSVVVICALAVAGIGGTLAGFTDTELSENNYFEVGSLDLRVGDAAGTEYDDPNLPTLIEANLMWPCGSQEFFFDMHSVSDPEGEAANAYIQFQDFYCAELPTTLHPTGRPEPENVAENGGELANETIAGLGPVRQNSTLPDFIEVYIQFDTDGDGALEPILGNPVWGETGTVYLGDLDSCWVDLGEIPAAEERLGKITLHISGWSEEEWNQRFGTSLELFPDDMPFNDWPTNALMLDKVSFNVQFALTQDPIPDDQVWPCP
jgi:predicted ribosomally synthesized peptide with SipW-like signal peptide